MNAPTKFQIITGPDGQPAFVVIPYDEYRKTLAKDTVPQEVVKRVFVENMSPVKAWREHLKLTQQEVAERIGISQPSYAKQERGVSLRKATRLKIAAALGITIEQLSV